MPPPKGRCVEGPNTTSTTPSLSAPTGLAVGLALKECATPELRRFAPRSLGAPMGSPLPGAVATGDSAGLLCRRGSLHHTHDKRHPGVIGVSPRTFRRARAAPDPPPP